MTFIMFMLLQYYLLVTKQPNKPFVETLRYLSGVCVDNPIGAGNDTVYQKAKDTLENKYHPCS